jgi:hypothetical protein
MLVAAVLHFIALCAIIFYRPECADFSEQLRLQHLTPYLHMSSPIAMVSFFRCRFIYLWSTWTLLLRGKFSNTLLVSSVHRYMTVRKCLLVRTVCVGHGFFFTK